MERLFWKQNSRFSSVSLRMVPQTWYKSLNLPLQAQISKMGILIFLAIPLLTIVNPSQGAILPKSSKGEHLNF